MVAGKCITWEKGEKIASDEKDPGTAEVDLISNNPLFTVGDHVAVRYAASVYLGSVLKYDRNDGEYFPSFMEQSVYYSNVKNGR